MSHEDKLMSYFESGMVKNEVKEEDMIYLGGDPKTS
jgi:hypothetical protein